MTDLLEDDEDDDADTVIEQGLTREDGAERRRQAKPFEQPHDGDRVGWRQDRAQHQAPDERHRHAQCTKHQPDAQSADALPAIPRGRAPARDAA